tara:strand:- start:180 stop:440 length:261 start_codon:yes stop_codon:yes gene_type:complete
MNKRKTIDINRVHELMDKHTMRTDEWFENHPDAHVGMCILLEDILWETGNYQGWGNYDLVNRETNGQPARRFYYNRQPQRKETNET